MDFVAVMLFTQQVFHLECLLLIRIKSQSGVAKKSVVYIKKHLTLLFSRFGEGGFKPSADYDIEWLKGWGAL